MDRETVADWRKVAVEIAASDDAAAIVHALLAVSGQLEAIAEHLERIDDALRNTVGSAGGR